MIYRNIQGDSFIGRDSEAVSNLPQADAVKSDIQPDFRDKGQAADGRDPISYQVFDEGETAAEFTYYIEFLRGGEARLFWIERLHLFDFYNDWATMEAVVRFLEYKCRAAGCPAMYVRVNRKNLSGLEMYQRYGFYAIDEEEIQLSHGQSEFVSVLKYPLPGTRDEALGSYIMQCERERAKQRRK